MTFSLASCQLRLARKPTAYFPCHPLQSIRERLRSPVVGGRRRLRRRQVPSAKFVGERLLRHIEEGMPVGRDLHQIRVGERRVVDFERLLLGSHALSRLLSRTCCPMRTIHSDSFVAPRRSIVNGHAGARPESEAIHESARQSRKSSRTPYSRQSRDREGALAKCVAGKRSLPAAAPIGVSRSSTSMSHTLDTRHGQAVSPATKIVPASGAMARVSSGMPSIAVVKNTHAAPSSTPTSGQVTRGDPGSTNSVSTSPSQSRISCAMPSATWAGL